jgi:hypothetical protein
VTGGENRLSDGLEPTPDPQNIDISRANPVTVLEEYMKSAVGSLLFQNGENKESVKTNGKTTKSSSNTTESVQNSSISEELDVNTANKELLQSAVLAEGRETLGRILNSNITGKSSGVESRSVANQIFELNLRDVSLHHFGPYGGNRVLYPLGKRYHG